MTDARFPLETACRLSRSVLWRLQRRFFERRGIAAWSEGVVPHHVTCNPYLARAYARVILGFVRDWRDRLDPAQPLYIVELGAGSGRLAFHVLRQLEPMLAEPQWRGVRVRYVLTDFAEANLAAWRAHPQLAPWLDAGRLDLARFDAEHDGSITPERTGETLAPGRVANPVIAIANYVFDGLPLDGFSVTGGRLHEWRVRLCATHPGELDDPELLERVRLTCELCPVEPAGYYGDPALDRVLDEHRARLPDTAFTFPSASLGCVARLAELAGGRLLVLSTDKGEVAEDGLRGQAGPQLTLHGSFSIAVNYHAIARWVGQQGGEALVPAGRPRTIATCGFVLGPPPGGAAETRRAYAEAVELQQPDDLFAIEQGLEPAHASL
ncbi:MAG TPA: SAM-dependent methyltransferase, partial [Kofleriaceae bacterium]